MGRLTIYTRRHCPYCIRALDILRKAGVEEVNEISIDGQEGRLRREIMERTGGRWDVPQVFIDDEHVGDDDDLEVLARSGELARRLGLSP